MSSKTSYLLTIVVLTVGPLSGAQALEFERTFQKRSPRDVTRVARSEPRPAGEPMPSDELLYGWRRKFLQTPATAPVEADQRILQTESIHAVLRDRDFDSKLAALNELHERLNDATPANLRLEVYEATIRVFRERFYEDVCDAWRAKLLIEFKGNSSACAAVHFDRATDAYYAGQMELALTGYLRVVRDYPESNLRGRALCNVGNILKQRGQIRDAIEAFRRVFSKSEEESFGPYVMVLFQSTYSDAARQLADCFERVSDLEQALDWNELARTQYHHSFGCGNCNAQIKMNNAVQQGRLLAKMGRRDDAIKILEPLVLAGSNGFADCPEEACWTLVGCYTTPEQIDAFAAKWHGQEQPEEASATVATVVRNKFRTPTKRAIALRRLILRGSCADLWTVIAEIGFTPYEIYSDRSVREQDEIPSFSRRAAIALLKRPDAGPFLLEKLRGSELEKGWAIVLLAQMNHPDTGFLLERATANAFVPSDPNPFSLELRRSLCCAIALHEDFSSRVLMTKYGIGTSFEIFGAQDLASLRTVQSEPRDTR